MKPGPDQFESTLTNFRRSDLEAPLEGRFCLIMMAGSCEGHVYQLSREITLVGRDDDADLQLMDEGISRRHALVMWDPRKGNAVIKDLKSHNGTMVNGQKITKTHLLQTGDKITLGLHTVIRVSCTSEVETRYAINMFQAMSRDTLTGVFNRRHLDERLVSEVSFANRHKTPLSLLFIDIDHFKKINDTYDHQCGDTILRQVAQLMGMMIRTEDELARYGGEEFAILCRQTTEDQGATMAQRIRSSIEAFDFNAKEHPIKCTISIGVASLDGEQIVDEKTLVAAADAALLTAKSQGRNRVIIASQVEESNRTSQEKRKCYSE
jgi:diguanylate cyclase (GGDEF)-like protein